MRIDPVTGHRVIIAGEPSPSGGGPAGPPPEPSARFVPVLGADEGPTPTGSPLEGVRANRDNDLFWRRPAVGVHELIDGADGLPATLEQWRERMRAFPDAACVHVAASASSLPQAELFALPFVPAEIARERERFGAYATRTMGGNLLGDLVQEEVRRRERIVAIDGEGVLMCAFAARVPYQLMLAPRTPRTKFEDDGPVCGALLQDALHRLERHLGTIAGATLWVRTAPSGAEHFGWRIDILPGPVRAPSPLEAGAGIPVNPVTPEAAAAALRD